MINSITSSWSDMPSITANLDLSQKTADYGNILEGRLRMPNNIAHVQQQSILDKKFCKKNNMCTKL